MLPVMLIASLGRNLWAKQMLAMVLKIETARDDVVAMWSYTSS